MRIGITSQNRREVTAHAGRCRRFWIFDVEEGRVIERSMLELDKAGTLHELAPAIPEGLKSVEVLLSAGMCEDLIARLERNGIRGAVTKHSDPEQAVASYLG